MPFHIDPALLKDAAQENADPRIIDGKAVARVYRSELARGVGVLREKVGLHPSLAVVLVGEDPASKTYVRHKVRACEAVGIKSQRRLLPANASAGLLKATLQDLNEDPEVHGILLQLPLPAHLDGVWAIEQIDPARDVDGFHHVNLGRLMLRSSPIEPCTPSGVMMMLRARGIDFQGREAVVVGRSMIVGRPMAQMLVRADATVTVCHRHTRNLAEHVSRADLLVVATGVPELIKGDWIKRGATVVDVGTTRVDGRLIGDVEFEAALDRVDAITPVPGGVGPMTVASLLHNTIRAALIERGLTIVDNDIVAANIPA